MIREARPEDAEGFVRAHEQAWDATLAPLAGKRLAELAPFEARTESFAAGIAQVGSDSGIWVAEREGEIVGVAVYRRDGERVGELKDLYVVPPAWGTGVAQELLATALAAMREAGLEDAVLWVATENARARRFYEREGWVADGSEKAGPLGREVRYRRATLP